MIKDFEIRLKSVLTKQRYYHCQGVRDEAVKMALRFGADSNKAEIAGILHDCAKGMNIDEQLSRCRELGLNLDTYTLACPAVIHAPLGAEIAKIEYGICDEEILQAIACHTVGRAEMTLLDKIIYIADMIEPARSFQGVDMLRKIADKDIDLALIECLKQTICFNVKKENIVHPATLECYNHMMMKNLSSQNRYKSNF